jgi:hypothetical protein
MNRKDHDLLSSTGSPIALGYATTNFYRNHKQLKTNTSHNDRALSATIRTGQSGKKILIFFIFTHKK